jgi:hypothetical protein
LKEKEIKLKDHNFLFTGLSTLIKGIKSNSTIINNADLSDYETEITDANKIIEELKKYLA